MVIDFTKVDSREQPPLILVDALNNKLGVINNVKDLKLHVRYNEMSQIEFSVPEYVNGIRTNNFDNITGLRMVELNGIGRFILVKPKDVRDGISTTKSCTGYSLEYELTYKKITLENDTYNLYNPLDDHTSQANLMDIILSMLPSWSIGTIDAELYNKYRTFDVSNENIYNFIKGTVQESYNCIFDFDTFNRTINIRSAKSTVPARQVFISNNNLAKEITIEEDTDNVVTRLDVNGADGVDIRDVNPDGTNSIINLDYYMNASHFPDSIVDKYELWKEKYAEKRTAYYNLSVEHSLQVMRRVTETAKLETLNGELMSLESQKSVRIQGGLDCTQINSSISSKNSEISEQKTIISGVTADIESILNDMKSINNYCNFNNFFTQDELKAIDHYIKEDSISESSFASVEKDFASSEDETGRIGARTITISGLNGSNIIRHKNKTDTKWVYSISGGILSIPNGNESWITSDIINASLEVPITYGDIMFTAVLGNGTLGETNFRTSCVSVSGLSNGGITSTGGGAFNVSDNEVPFSGTYISFSITNGFLYFTMDTSEYQKHYVAWDLFEYGSDILQKISQPSYSFSVTSANFFSLDEFVSFKNHINLGDKIYLEIYDGMVLKPILIGATISYGDYTSLDLEFGDKYISSESAFQLADLLEQSVSMGKSVDVSRFTYSAFVDSGAKTAVGEFMKNALDVSKNAILSTGDQAFTLDDAGFRLRKWKEGTNKTVYEDNQLWMSNNCIMMTRDSWNSASMAIGEIEFGTERLYGVVADCIVGRLIAGNSLVIESSKKSGGTSVFRVDGDGCSLYNSSFQVFKSGVGRVKIDPETGLVIYKGNNTSDADRVFYADNNGNLTISSNITSASAIFKPTNATVGSYYTAIEDGHLKVGVRRVLNGTTMDVIIGQIDWGVDESNTMTSSSIHHVGIVAMKNSSGIAFCAQKNDGGTNLLMAIRNRVGENGVGGSWYKNDCDIVMACSAYVQSNFYVGGNLNVTGNITGSLDNATGTFKGGVSSEIALPEYTTLEPIQCYANGGSYKVAIGFWYNKLPCITFISAGTAYHLYVENDNLKFGKGNVTGSVII